VEVRNQKFVAISTLKHKRTHQVKEILEHVGVKLTQFYGCDEIVSFTRAEPKESHVIYKTILEHKQSDTYVSWNTPKGLEIDLNVSHDVKGARVSKAPERLKPVVEPKKPRNTRKNVSCGDAQAKRQRFCRASEPEPDVTESDDDLWVPVSQLSERGQACARDLAALASAVEAEAAGEANVAVEANVSVAPTLAMAFGAAVEPNIAVNSVAAADPVVAPPVNVPIVQAQPIRAYYDAMPPDPIMAAEIEKLKAENQTLTAENDKLKAVDDVKTKWIADKDRHLADKDKQITSLKASLHVLTE